MKTIARILVVLLLAGAAACTTVGQRSQEMLATDYTALADPELMQYYRRLNDQLAHSDRKARTSGDRSEHGDALRERRNAVRAELAARGLMP